MSENITYDDFQGLDTSDPLTATGAVDLYNVLPGRDGAIRSRPGLHYQTSFPTGGAYSTSSNFELLFTGYAGATARRVSGMSGPSETMVDDGASGWDADASQAFSAASFGTPSAAYLLLARDGSTLMQYDGAAFAAVTYSGQNPTAKWVAVQPGDNRVVVAGPSLGGGHRVYFSDPGDHTAYNTNNYVGLTPGDGETISAVVAWQSMVLVFKQTRIFVFYGASTDATGQPVFNYRVIEGVGAVSATYMSAVASNDGVYFWHNPATAGATIAGLYRTDGNSVTRVSRNIDLAVGLNASGVDTLLHPPYLTFPGLSYQTDAALSVTDEYIWIPVKSGSQHLTLAFHIPTNQSYLLKWDSATTDRIYSATGTIGDAVYAVNGTSWIRAMGGLWTQDTKTNVASATDYASLYRTGHHDLGHPHRTKVIRETLVTGTGAPDIRVSSDFASLDAAGAVTLGTAPALGTGRRRTACKGKVFSTAISSSAGIWGVSRLTHRITSAAAD